MSGEMRADRDYREHRPGYYVVNPATEIAVFFAKTQERAEREREWRERSESGPTAGLQVVVIGGEVNTAAELGGDRFSRETGTHETPVTLEPAVDLSGEVEPGGGR